MSPDPREQEVIDKLSRLVAAPPFAGDFEKAFAHYSAGSGDLNEADVMVLLADAGIGTWLTRRWWAGAFMKRVDADGNRVISLAELRAKIEGKA